MLKRGEPAGSGGTGQAWKQRPCQVQQIGQIGAVARARHLSSGWAASSGHCPVDLPAVPDPHDQDDELPIHDLVDDPVVPDAQPVAVVVSSEFHLSYVGGSCVVPAGALRLNHGDGEHEGTGAEDGAEGGADGDAVGPLRLLARRACRGRAGVTWLTGAPSGPRRRPAPAGCAGAPGCRWSPAAAAASGGRPGSRP
jgi:hypothetical protein